MNESDLDPRSAELLLPLVYEELKTLAISRLAREKPGQTLQATALVHEAYLRLVHDQAEVTWDGRAHFFAAAAEAMRRILVEHARRRRSHKHGGTHQRVEIAGMDLPMSGSHDEVLIIDETLTLLEQENPEAAELVRLRYFGGLTVEEAADALGVPRSTAYRRWTFARAWMRAEILDQARETK